MFVCVSRNGTFVYIQMAAMVAMVVGYKVESQPPRLGVVNTHTKMCTRRRRCFVLVCLNYIEIRGVPIGERRRRYGSDDDARAISCRVEASGAASAAAAPTTQCCVLLLMKRRDLIFVEWFFLIMGFNFSRKRGARATKRPSA